MNVTYMKYALEVAKQGSINRAADTLLIGQPNLSRAVKSLEDEIGLEIFERSARGMSPTPAGQEFLSYAENVIRQLNDMEEYYRSGVHTKETFSISVPRADYIAEAAANFTNRLGKNPSEIIVMETSTKRAINNILHSGYKLGIIRYMVHQEPAFISMLEASSLAYNTISEFSNIILMNENCPLARQEEIHYHDLANYIEVMAYAPSYSTPLADLQTEEQLNSVQRKIYCFGRASQHDILRLNNEAFMWTAPIRVKDSPENKGLVQRRCVDEETACKDILIYKKGYRFTKLDEMFIEELSKVK